jgi:hypothetical protein
VSSFLDTHVVRGYLLGHALFVSTMDAVSCSLANASDVIDGEEEDGGKDDDNDGSYCGRGRTLCVTGSGNSTVHLWDCASCGEIGMVPVAIHKCPAPFGEVDAKNGETNGGENGVEEDKEEEGGRRR